MVQDREGVNCGYIHRRIPGNPPPLTGEQLMGLTGQLV